MAIGNINVNTLKDWMNKNEVMLVDVREPAEWDANRIEGAVLIPLATVPHTTMPSVTGKKLVIYCRSGKRSQTACEVLMHLNPALEVYNLEGGILAWEAAQHNYSNSV